MILAIKARPHCGGADLAAAGVGEQVILAIKARPHCGLDPATRLERATAVILAIKARPHCGAWSFDGEAAATV